MVNAKTFLEKRYNEELELEDAVHTAILTLKVRWWEGARVSRCISLLPLGWPCLPRLARRLCATIMQEGFEGQMTENNIEIGIVDDDGFRRLEVGFCGACYCGGPWLLVSRLSSRSHSSRATAAHRGQGLPCGHCILNERQTRRGRVPLFGTE